MQPAHWLSKQSYSATLIGQQNSRSRQGAFPAAHPSVTIHALLALHQILAGNTRPRQYLHKTTGHTGFVTKQWCKSHSHAHEPPAQHVQLGAAPVHGGKSSPAACVSGGASMWPTLSTVLHAHPVHHCLAFTSVSRIGRRSADSQLPALSSMDHAVKHAERQSS